MNNNMSENMQENVRDLETIRDWIDAIIGNIRRDHASPNPFSQR